MMRAPTGYRKPDDHDRPKDHLYQIPMLSAMKSEEARIEALVDAAIAADGSDNVSAILAQLPE